VKEKTKKEKKFGGKVKTKISGKKTATKIHMSGRHNIWRMNQCC
jgi:hypothetical protein